MSEHFVSPVFVRVLTSVAAHSDLSSQAQALLHVIIKCLNLLADHSADNCDTIASSGCVRSLLTVIAQLDTIAAQSLVLSSIELLDALTPSAAACCDVFLCDGLSLLCKLWVS